MIFCNHCGEISRENATLYDDRLKKQTINILPVHAACKLCGAELSITNKANGGNLIVLNGTCGSGKTTVAEMLTGKGWLAIDGDCAVQSLRHKKGTKEYEWSELLNEIAYEIDVLSLFHKNIVLSHIILPEDINQFIKLFKTRNLKYKLILLKPEYQTALTRCQTRDCHETITPEKWVKHFYDILTFDDLFEMIDNTNMTAEETAELILKMPYQN